MTSYELYKIRQENATFAQYRPEYIQQVCDELGVTLDAAGEAIYLIALQCEEYNNRGLEQQRIPEELRWVLVREAEALRGDILFYAVGSRKNDYDGWGVKRRPPWQLVWGHRFGWATVIGQQLLTAMEVEARERNAIVDAQTEESKAKRKVDRLAGKPADDLTTMEVAYLVAVSELMARRYRARWAGVGFTDVYVALTWHYNELNSQAICELRYRRDHPIKPNKRSKKQVAKAADWAKAAEILHGDILRYFFSEAFVQYAVNCAEEPDLRVDFEHLPKQPPDKTPVMWLRDGELVQEFMRLLDEAEPGSFEREDVDLILNNLRKQLARVKGQKVES